MGILASVLSQLQGTLLLAAEGEAYIARCQMSTPATYWIPTCAMHSVGDLHISPCQVGMTVSIHKRQVQLALQARLARVGLGAQSILGFRSYIKNSTAHLRQFLGEQYLEAALVTPGA